LQQQYIRNVVDQDPSQNGNLTEEEPKFPIRQLHPNKMNPLTITFGNK